MSAPLPLCTDYATQPKGLWPKVVTRSEAKERGLTHYFTGRPCPRKHYSVRLYKDAGCYACHKAYRLTERGKAKAKAQRQSPRGRATKAAYCKTKKGKEINAASKRTVRGRINQAKASRSVKGKASIRRYTKSEKGTRNNIRNNLRQAGFAPEFLDQIPEEYIKAVHAGRVIKRQLKQQKQ